MISGVTLVPASDYVQRLIADINGASRSIHIAAIAVVYDRSTKPIFDSLTAALARGVAVHIAVDNFTFAELSGIKLGPIIPWLPSSQPTRHYLQLLSQQGAHVTWLGKRFVWQSVTGRCHVKWCIVDDVVYSFGGINLYKVGRFSDYMLRMESTQLATTLATEQVMLRGAGFSGAQDTIDDTTSWYIDSGKPGQSTIYERAARLATESKSAIYVSQYRPGGKLEDQLSSIDTRYYFNRAPQLNHGFDRWLVRLDQWRASTPNHYRKSRYIHAKYIIFTKKDGSTVALCGSHNFNWNGVQFGTKEIALETSRTDICQALADFTATYIT